MPTTPTYSLPYPLATDPADVPLDMRELAEATEAALTGFDTRDDAQDVTLASLDARLDAIEAAPPGSTDYVRIAEIVLGADGPSIDFTGIPATYRHLTVHGLLRGVTAAAFVVLRARFNNDATAIYDSNQIAVQGVTAVPLSAAGATSGQIGYVTGGSNPDAARAAAVRLEVIDYAGTAWWKTAVAETGHLAATSTDSIGARNAILWRSTAAINRVTLFAETGNLKAGSKATLYGLK